MGAGVLCLSMPGGAEAGVTVQRIFPGLLAGLVWTLALPARAECLGQGCYDGLVTALAAIVLYGLIAIVVLVMLIRRKWRRAGLKTLAVVLLLALGVPFLSQSWQGLRSWSMTGREVAGTPPPMAGRVPLLIADKSRCHHDACEAVLHGRQGSGVFALPLDALARLEPGQPLVLADLPLEHWSIREPGHAEPSSRWLSLEERQAAAETIDYIVIAGRPFYLSEPGPIEAALGGHPALQDLARHEIVKLAMAAVGPGGTVDLTSLRFDILDLWLVHEALGYPLAVGNLRGPRNPVAGLDRAAQALCPSFDGTGEWTCRDMLD